MVEVPAFGGRMKIVAYLDDERTIYYRIILDVLLEEEERLGGHLGTAEIAKRVRTALVVEPELLAELPPMDDMLERLRRWGNVVAIHNTGRSSTPDEFVRRDNLYQLSSAGARVHREMMQIERDMNDGGALHSSMLPEVLTALTKLVRGLESASPDSKIPRPVSVAAGQAAPSVWRVT